MPGIRFALIASLALLATACHAPEPPPTDEPPEPQATASTTPSGTELRDAMQAPIQKAEAVQIATLGGQSSSNDATAQHRPFGHIDPTQGFAGRGGRSRTRGRGNALAQYLQVLGDPVRT